jgi:GDPmannose 4,6-dehydratase
MIPYTKIYNASTSEMFGNQPIPQDETTLFDPKSPYACAKVFAHHLCDVYRDSYKMFICSGILFNHASPRRSSNFILRKIAIGVVNYKKDNQSILELGNLNAKRDIGFSKDYVEGMWMMLQQDKPDNYVLASGVQYTIREFVEIAFSLIGKTIAWKNSGLNEVGCDENDNILVKVNSKYFRPNEVENLLGNSTKAYKQFGWKPMITTQKLLKEIIEYELNKNHL